MQRVLIYTGFNRWHKASEEFVRQFELSILVNNNPGFYHDQQGLFTQVITLHRNTIGLNRNILTFPVLEKYMVGLSLIPLYARYGLIDKQRSYVYVGHTDTWYDLNRFETILSQNPGYAFYVWRRASSPETFHSDAFIVNLGSLDLKQFANVFSAQDAEPNAEHEMTAKLTAVGPCHVLGVRERGLEEQGFHHVH